MSKNLTRKGLAFGALIALGTSLFAGAPAQAANVSIDVEHGTGNKTILGEVFTVKATIDSLVPSSAFKTLKFKVTNSSEAALTYTANTHSLSADTTGKVDGSTGTTSTGSSDVVFEASDASAESSAGTGTLGIKTSATTATSVSVVAFLDADGGDDLDAGEYQTAAYEVSFVKAADAGITTALTAPQIGDASLKATVTSSVINVSQIATNNLRVQFGIYGSGATPLRAEGTNTYTYGTLVATNTDAASGELAAIDTDTYAKRTVTSNAVDGTNVGASVVAGSYSAQAVWSPIPGTTAYVKIGSESVKAAAALKVVVSGTDKSKAVITSDENVTSYGVVRKDYTGNVVLTVTLKDTDKVVIADRVVRMTTTYGSTTGTIKVNGVAAPIATANGTFEATTNASGVATFTITSSTATASDILTVATLTADGVDLTPTISGWNKTFNWDAATYTAVHKTAEATTRAVNKGSNYDFSVVVLDQWKKAYTNAAYRFVATVSGRTSATYNGDIASGVANFSIADGGLASDSNSVTFEWQQNKSTGWTASSPDVVVASPGTLTLNYYTQTDAVTASATDAVNNVTPALSARAALKALVAVDTRQSNTAAASVVTSGTYGNQRAIITGTVTNAATGVLRAGALVTVTADPSIYFNVGSVWGAGSITFNDADGNLAIYAYSNKIQSKTVVTITSGGVSKTAKVSFTGGPTNVGKTVTVSAPTYIQAGGTLIATIKVADEFGNGVDTDITATDWDDSSSAQAGETDAEFSVTYSGPGIIFGSALPTATDADGLAKISALLGSTDVGTITIKATYGGADGVIGTGDDDIVTTQSVTVGAGAAPAAAAAKANVVAKTKAFSVSVSGNASAKNVVVKVAGKTVATLKGSASAKTYTVKATKGSKKVTVYVGGKLLLTKTVSVK